MFKHYYINKQTSSNPNNNHEVHVSECQWLPSVNNREYLGYFSSCADAIRKAKETYTNIDGCAICCPLCHKD